MLLELVRFQFFLRFVLWTLSITDADVLHIRDIRIRDFFDVPDDHLGGELEVVPDAIVALLLESKLVQSRSWKAIAEILSHARLRRYMVRSNWTCCSSLGSNFSLAINSILSPVGCISIFPLPLPSYYTRSSAASSPSYEWDISHTRQITITPSSGPSPVVGKTRKGS